MKSVPWSSLFPLVSGLGVLVEHTPSYGRAELTAWPYIKLDMQTCINRILHIFLQMIKHVAFPSHIPCWPFLKWPKQSSFHAWLGSHAFGKKRVMFQVCSWFYSPSRAIPHWCFQPHFSWPKRTKHAIKTTQNAAYDLTLILHSNFQSCPLMNFHPWATVYLTLHTLYKSIMTWFHKHTPLRREKHDLHIEACKHFSPLEALPSSFLLLLYSHLKTTNHC